MGGELEMAAKVQQACSPVPFPLCRGWITPEFACPRRASAATTMILSPWGTENWDCCWRMFPARECLRHCWERRCMGLSGRSPRVKASSEAR